MGDVIVASTSDTQEEVNAAAGGAPQNEEPPEPKAPPTGDPQIDSEAEPEPEQKEAQAKPVPRGVDKRIDKLVRQNKELQERLAAVEAAKPTPKAESVPEPPPVPMQVADDFDTFDDWSQKQVESGKSPELRDYNKAQFAWMKAKEQQEQEKAEIQEYQAQVSANYREKVLGFKAEHEDWDDVVGQEIDIPPVVGPAIMQLENGPEVAYYLGKNPQFVKQLNEMEPLLAVAQIGYIAARLEKAPPEEQPTIGSKQGPDRVPVTSKAPAPIKPLTGHAVRSTRDLNDPNIPYDEYCKIRDEQAKNRFRR